MKLLLDQNLAPRLVAALAALYPDSKHVRDVGLASAHDDDVWRYAAAGGFTIVSKDADLLDERGADTSQELMPRSSTSRLIRERRFWLWAEPLSLSAPPRIARLNGGA